jgi:hypothetical protein
LLHLITGYPTRRISVNDITDYEYKLAVSIHLHSTICPQTRH